MTLRKCLEFVSIARARGLIVPVVLMGYYNPFLSYGKSLMEDAASSGVNGFIISDLPSEEAFDFVKDCGQAGYVVL